MICCICLLDLVLNVYKRISGDTHDIQLVVNRIEAADHNGVGIIAYLIGTGDEEGIHAVLSAVNMVRICVIRDALIIRIGRLDHKLKHRITDARNQHEYQQDNQNDLAGLFLFALFVSRGDDLVNALAGLLFRGLGLGRAALSASIGRGSLPGVPAALFAAK